MIINPYRFASAGFTDPTDIAGLDLWLDASDNSTVLDATDTVAADNEAVKTWQDKSGNANHAVQTTVSQQPLRRAAEINSLDAVDFDGINDLMVGGSLTPRQTDAKTLFAVSKFDTGTTAGTGGTLLDLYNATSVGEAGLVTGEIAYRTNTRTWVSTTPVGTTNPHIITMSQSGSGNLWDVVNMWLDGASVTRTGTTNGVLVDTVAFYNIGGVARSSLPFNGKICEVIVYDSELSAGDRGDVETHLANKWGITI
jgi:hypothetical protein